jgi:hypothetical protein
MQYIKERTMQNKLVAVVAAALMMAVPTLGVAAMAGPNTVNSAAIVDGAVTTVDLANQAVTTSKIADGSVTDAKLSGVISSTKLPIGTTSTSIAVGNHNHDTIYSNIVHNHDAAYQKKAAKIAIVAQSGGDYNSPYSAMNEVAAWCGEPSAINPCLIKLMPGEYDNKNATLYMREYVDIEGSGENTTKIKGNPQFLISGANNAEIRFLSLEQYGTTQGVAQTIYAYQLTDSFRVTNVSILVYGSDNAYAISAYNSSPTLTNVTAKSAGSYDNSAFFLANTNGKSPVMNNVRLLASGATFRNCGLKILNSTDTTLTNITIVADKGIETQKSSVRISNVDITATDTGVYNEDSVVTISNTRIEAPSGLNTWYGFMPTSITMALRRFKWVEHIAC